MGLFSGNKSSTSSSTTNNSSTLGIQGDLTGILGDGNYMFSDTSRTDVMIDASDNSDRRVDNSDNSRVDWWQDNSDNSDTTIDLEGQLAGATVGGDLIMTGDGAWAFGKDVVKELGATMQTALKNATEQTYLATKAAEEAARIASSASSSAASSAMSFAKDATRSIESTANSALSSNQYVSKQAIDGVLYASEEANKAISSQTQRLADTAAQSTQAAINASNNAMERNAALIQTTALGGQDLMIDAMKKVMMYGAGVLAAGLLFMTFKGAKS